MNLNPFKRQQKTLTATSGVIQAMQQGWSPFPLLGGGSQQRIIDTYNTAQGANYAFQYQKSPAVRTVIDVIVRNIGQLDLRLYEEMSESERNPRPDHPAALSLRYPDEGAPQATPGDKFIREMFKDFLIYDNAFAVIAPGPNGQVQLKRIPAFMVQVQGGSLFRVDNYRVWPQGAWGPGGNWSGAGAAENVDPANMLHWHGEHPLDPRVGLSKLDTLRDVIAEDAALAAAIVELANNGLQAPIWVSRPLEAPEMNPKTARAHEEDLANRLRNRNRIPPVMMEGEQLQSFGTSPQDAQMMDVRKWAVIRVASVFGVPPALVGISEGRVDLESQSVFYKDTLPPYCEDFCRMLNQRLLVEVFDWEQGTFEFNLDEKTGWSQLPNLISATGRPIMTTDEGRAKINLPPVPGGDQLVTPGNVAIGGKPSVGAMPIQDPNGPPQDGSYRQSQGPRTGPASAPSKPSFSNADAQYGTSTSAADAVYASLDGGEEKKIPIQSSYQSRRHRAKARQDRNITRFHKTVGNFLKGMEPKLRSQTKSTSRKAIADWEHWVTDFSRLLFRAIRDVVASEGAITSSQLGSTFNLGETTNYRKAMATGSAQQIMDSIRRQVDEHGVDYAVNRFAPLAASTAASLGTRATVWARREAGHQSGQGNLQETWVKDTERHAHLDGKSVPLGGQWEGGLQPGSTPGCKCTSVVT